MHDYLLGADSCQVSKPKSVTLSRQLRTIGKLVGSALFCNVMVFDLISGLLYRRPPLWKGDNNVPTGSYCMVHSAIHNTNTFIFSNIDRLL